MMEGLPFFRGVVVYASTAKQTIFALGVHDKCILKVLKRNNLINRLPRPIVLAQLIYLKPKPTDHHYSPLVMIGNSVII